MKIETNYVAPKRNESRILFQSLSLKILSSQCVLPKSKIHLKHYELMFL